MWKNLWRSENGFYFLNKLCFSFIVDFFHLCWIREIFHILVFLTLIVKCSQTTARCSPGWGGLLWPPKRKETLGSTASYSALRSNSEKLEKYRSRSLVAFCSKCSYFTWHICCGICCRKFLFCLFHSTVSNSGPLNIITVKLLLVRENLALWIR